MDTGTLSEQLRAAQHLDFGTFWFYPNLVVGEVRGGMRVNANHALHLMTIAAEYYPPETPVVYLSDRKYSYSIDPTLHLEIQEFFPNLIGYGVVVYNDLNARVAELEQRFLPCPTGIFRSMDAATAWAVDRVLRFEDAFR